MLMQRGGKLQALGHCVRVTVKEMSSNQFMEGGITYKEALHAVRDCMKGGIAWRGGWKVADDLFFYFYLSYLFIYYLFNYLLINLFIFIFRGYGGFLNCARYFLILCFFSYY